MTNNAQQLNEDDVLDILTTSNRQSTEHNIADPITKAHIQVTLDQIKSYDLNPRKTKNPKFDELLESIENTGLDQPPSITRRNPDDEFYMIHNGGNTRLEVLNVLYAKYSKLAHESDNDEEKIKHTEKANSFFYLNWEFKPYSGELRTFIGHMAENETQGDMLFVEKAGAIKVARELYSKVDRETAERDNVEFIDKPLSFRKLAKRITTDGWPVSYSHIPRYDYTNKCLSDCIPEALLSGLGHGTVSTIKKYDEAYNEFWSSTEQGKSDAERIRDLFFSTLNKHDNKKLDLKEFIKELNQNISDIIDVPNNSIMTEVEAIISGVNNSPINDIATNQPSENLVETYKKTSPNNNSKPSTNTSGSPVKEDKKKQTESIGLVNQYPESIHEQEDLLFKLVLKLADVHNITVVQVPKETQDAAKCNIFAVHPLSTLNEGDEEKAVLWWYLTKMSRAYRAAADNYMEAMNFLASAMEDMYAYYIRSMGLLGTILFLEEQFIELKPDVRGSLSEIQLLIEHIHSSKSSV